MSMNPSRSLAGLATLTLLAACTESRDLPTELRLAAHSVAVRRPSVPGAQGYPLLAYDPVKDRVWAVGGFTTEGSLIYDLWAFNVRLQKWTQAPSSSGPSSWDAVALDRKSRKLILYQGYSAAFDAVDVETWAYDIDSGVWENRSPALQPPTRWGSMMVYDPVADRVLLYGGANFAEGLACGFCGTTTVRGDLWAYDYESNTWTERHPSVNPPPHHFPVLEYVPAIDRIILFGGFQQGFATLFNDTWAYDYRANRWANLHPANPPAPRAYHYIALEPRTNRIVMFGGVEDESAYPDSPEITNNETWIYTVANNSWRQVFPREAPGPHAWHAMSRTNGAVFLFGGGATRSTWTNDTYLYSSPSNEWERVPGEQGGHGPESDIAVLGLTGGGHVFRGGWAFHR